MSKKNIEKKFSTIEIYIFDQGGSSSCSNCDYSLRDYLDYYFSSNKEDRKKTGLEPYSNLTEFLQKNELQCPGCESYLEFGKTDIQQGGSDF